MAVLHRVFPSFSRRIIIIIIIIMYYSQESDVYSFIINCRHLTHDNLCL